MGRNYIAERAITDPALRARVKRQKALRARAERAALAAYLERAKRCMRKGCQALRPGDGDPGWRWWPCCSEACWQANETELGRQAEVRAARLAGVPVKQWRKAQSS